MSRIRVPLGRLVLAGLLLLSLFHFGRAAYSAGSSGFVDLPIFFANAEQFLESGRLYPFAENLEAYAPAAAVYKFPPLYATFLIPSVRDGVQAHDYMLHWGVQLLLYVIAAGWTIWLLRSEGGGGFVWLALLIALNFEPFFETLWRLQIETPLLFMLALVVYGMLRGREMLVGVVLGCAAMLKVYPLFLLAYFVIRRRWAVVGWALAAMSLVGVACVIIFGVEQNRVYFLEILPWMGGEAPTLTPENLSPGRYMQQWFGVTPETAKTLMRVVAVPLGLLSWYAVQRHVQSVDDRHGTVVEFAMFVALMLLVMPNSWGNYQTLLLVPILVLVAAGYRRGRVRPWVLVPTLIAGGLLLFYIPCADASVGWPCAQTPWFLGLIQLPRGLHDALVECRGLASLIVWGTAVGLLFSLSPARSRSESSFS